MINNLEKYIKLFNDDINQEISGFGKVDPKLFDCESELFLLFYLYPMIERLIRCILDLSGTFDLENSEQCTYKTLASIFEQNKKEIKTLLGKRFGIELCYYIEETFADAGPRNAIMHYSSALSIAPSAVLSAMYIFEKLIKFYVVTFC